MNTYPLVKIALDGLTYNGIAVPVAQIRNEGKAKTYLNHYTYLDTDEFFTDDEPQAAGTYGTVDIFSDKRDALTELLPQIKQRPRDAHLTIGDTGPQQYANDTPTSHLPTTIYHERQD